LAVLNYRDWRWRTAAIRKFMNSSAASPLRKRMTQALYELLQLLGAGLLGLLVGALLAEAFLLVPVWRSMPSDAFFAAHSDYGPRLYRFFAPLTIAATATAMIAAIASLAAPYPGRWGTLLAGVLAIGMLGLYFAYFRRANGRFAEGRMTAQELSEELRRWAMWHWVRVGLGLVAFGAALVGVNAAG
jgi:hypothetical protein